MNKCKYLYLRNIFLWFYKVTGWCSSDIGNLGKIYIWLSHGEHSPGEDKGEERSWKWWLWFPPQFWIVMKQKYQLTCCNYYVYLFENISYIFSDAFLDFLSFRGTSTSTAICIACSLLLPSAFTQIGRHVKREFARFGKYWKEIKLLKYFSSNHS